jgi:hypothetical protein
MRNVAMMLLLVVSLASPATLPAQTTAAQPQPPEILAEQRQLRLALENADPRYADLTPFRRNRIYKAQDQVFTLVEGHARLDELAIDEQLRLFNALELIGSHLGKRDEAAHMVCERIAIVGSRRQQMACMEKGERDRRAQRAVDALMTRPACTTSDCI